MSNLRKATPAKEMKSNLETYRESREVLLTSIITELSADERCLAAWLTGSYARNEADDVSDLDIAIVIAEPYSETLCARQEQVSPETTPERLALFKKFGEPALIHENNNNAPEGGTFTFVLYSASALMIDWILLPQTNAERPLQSLLLFDKANIPVASPSEPESLEASRKFVAEQWAFFWMMAAVTAKYVVRGDAVFVTRWLEILHGLVEEIERHLLGKPSEYIRGSLSQLQPTREMQIESIRSLCRMMQALAPQIESFGGTMLGLPSTEVETLLALVDDDSARH